MREIVERAGSLAPVLPLLLNLKGKPYRLDDHFVFEPFFQLRPPGKLLYMTGRQVAKSTSLAAQGVVQSLVIAHFNTLYVLPQFELARRFSNNYVKSFIDDAPVRVWPCVTNTVLQRQFANRAGFSEEAFAIRHVLLAARCSAKRRMTTERIRDCRAYL